jgi:hypothetical protein
MGVKSMRRVAAPPKKSIPLPPPEKPEDQVDKNEVDTSRANSDVKRHNYNLKEDDNGNRGQKHIITCVCCGKPKYEDYFYLNKSSFVFDGVYNRVPVCKDCLDSLYRRFSMQYDQVASAAAVIAIMDLPYIEAVVRTQIEDGRFKIGNYAKGQNLVAMKDKTFIDSIVTGAFFDAKDKLKVDMEKLWEPQDKRNKKFVISKFGYDPFESFDYEDGDYRNAFNITAKYLEDESILQDAHKMQSLITMVATIIQSNKIETLLTYQYRNIKPDINEIKTLTATKKDLQATISKLAEDNNISSKYQKENKSAQSHLTAKMKEMEDVGYWEAKPNMFDVRTSAAMRQVADLSHQSILEQLELTDSDYAAMVKEQREMIKNLQDDKDRLEEEVRNLTNRYIEATLEGGKK